MRRRQVLGGLAGVLAAPLVRAQSSTDGLAEAYIAANGLPGVTWAVRRASGEVFSGAAGYADPEAGERMVPDHRLRIASISKTMTAAMILTLEAEGRLDAGHRPLGPDGLLAHLVPSDLAYRDLLDQITIDHLLTHTSGGWGNLLFDPMFMFKHTDQADLIRLTLMRGKPGAAAGTAHVYSNFGYCLLGRVIESVVGGDCTASIRARLAETAGASSFGRAGDTLSDRLEGEVVYVSTDADPYDLRMGRLDSAGGFVVSAPDLLAMFAGFDGAGGETMPQGIAARMAEPWKPGGSYGRGLMLNPVHGNRWHNGSLPGTTSLAVMVEGGDLICALCNGRTETSFAGINDFARDIHIAVTG